MYTIEYFYQARSIRDGFFLIINGYLCHSVYYGDKTSKDQPGTDNPRKLCHLVINIARFQLQTSFKMLNELMEIAFYN